MPLYIFEPRYRSMLADAVAGERRIAVGLIVGEAVRPVCGVGRIVRHEPRGDGTSDIVLAGEFRARILSTRETGPYLTAEIARHEELAFESEEHRLRLMALFGDARVERLPLGALADLAASALMKEPADRQAVLESLDVRERAERLCAMLGPPAAGMN